MNNSFQSDLAWALYDLANKIGGHESLPWSILTETDPELAAVYTTDAIHVAEELAKMGWAFKRENKE